MRLYFCSARLVSCSLYCQIPFCMICLIFDVVTEADLANLQTVQAVFSMKAERSRRERSSWSGHVHSCCPFRGNSYSRNGNMCDNSSDMKHRPPQ